ncbi:MAG: hypothetical protein B7Z15_03235 [Rhizobiales bacterium 32-66-8]|nr:MAG: hypothetical protein B7Z15_03235 [Rhizobiales bacterium 32-66-8]
MLDRAPPAPRRPQVALLADGRRLHLNDGPIDLVIEASGADAAVAQAYAAAQARFTGLLDELCLDLTVLRRPPTAGDRLSGAVARRMQAAVLPHAPETFITPMAAVAGAVAEEILAALVRPGLTRAYVNNGGDIALFLAPGAEFTVGLVDRPDQPRLIGTVHLGADSGIGGIATSGWRGRSFSLGIADAVTVLAASAAAADAAATVIANAVDLPGHPGVERMAACALQPDTDLGARLVTRAVAPLTPEACAAALAQGLSCATALVRKGLIQAAALHLQGHSRATDPTLLAARPLSAPAGKAVPLSRSSNPEKEHAHA